MTGAVLREGLIREGIEGARGDVGFELTIPRGGVERAEPRAEIGEFTRCQIGDVVFDALDVSHGASIAKDSGR